MFYMEEGIAFETKLGDGSEATSGIMGKLLGAAMRGITGETIFLTHFTNRGSGKQHVSFAAPYPGTIVPVDLAALGGEVILQKDAFLCAAMGTHITIAFNKKIEAYGTITTKLPKAEQQKARKLAMEILNEKANKDPYFKKVWESQKAFIESYKPYYDLTKFD
jgi:hypothetical protein